MRLLGATVMAMLVLGGSAQAADIEGVWTFGEGQVSVVPDAGGTFSGTVVKPTSFSDCAHPVGQKMWISITPQPDGQYFGKHQWFNNSTSCDPNGAFGPTAYRVLTQPDGKKLLRVCFSSPDRPDAQPTIAPDGTGSGMAYGSGYTPGNPCEDSSYVGPVAQPTFNNTVILPAASKTCRSRRSFRIRLRQPAGDPLVSAVVKVNGKQVKVVKGERLTAPVDLRGLPKGRYTVSIVVKTTLGRTIQGSRKYRTCVPKRRG